MQIVKASKYGDAPSELRSATFTGLVYADPVLASPGEPTVARVFFAPAARTFWHWHERGQLLYVISGRGLICTEGGLPQELEAGDTVWARAGGAALARRRPGHRPAAPGRLAGDDELAGRGHRRRVRGRALKMATIGFAGLGHMGTPMVGRLAAAGHLLRVYDVDPAARARHEGMDGVAVVGQVTEIADGADVVILMLPDSAVVAQVLLADGLLEHVAASAVVIDMSSSVPARTRELAAAAAQRGVTLIDAPVSGGVAGARSGSLTIMAGGPAEILDQVRPVLEVLGSHVVHAGDMVGAGHAIKALNNLMSAAHLLASSEALLAGRAVRAGSRRHADHRQRLERAKRVHRGEVAQVHPA